ncbi:hypothetical protein RFI_09469 [Reticulomyxa filosa]|uniref:Uncharacterized protein n=1 Tax=Reticulomyxa filosa TaxID=46433 RepID=X6NPN6_RETFI|nr:hypothetical protein RFI_09469 [Reticulomyxa filosa]|eukprot:ETO27664.1 hypothetical protein RFI_09469 [Reticulomyxa filosa]
MYKHKINKFKLKEIFSGNESKWIKKADIQIHGDNILFSKNPSLEGDKAKFDRNTPIDMIVPLKRQQHGANGDEQVTGNESAKNFRGINVYTNIKYNKINEIGKGYKPTISGTAIGESGKLLEPAQESEGDDKGKKEVGNEGRSKSEGLLTVIDIHFKWIEDGGNTKPEQDHGKIENGGVSSEFERRPAKGNVNTVNVKQVNAAAMEVHKYSGNYGTHDASKVIIEKQIEPIDQQAIHRKYHSRC